MKWWLIKDEDVKEIRDALEEAIKKKDDQCASSGCLCDLTNTYCSGWLRDALHTLDSGCHSTDQEFAAVEIMTSKTWVY